MINRGELNKQFIHHAPCERCGSKDNVAVYADGHGYCFSCKIWHTKRDLGNYPDQIESKKKKINSNNYTYTKGKKHDIPWSLDFTGAAGQKRKEFKDSKGYDQHHIYTDEEGNTTFVVERQ